MGGGARVQLAHRRLSIIDLSTAADQPLVKDGLHLSYNGEVYNFRELRAELERAGVRFVTRSDTEVVLEAVRAWGTGALSRLRGMFAFALFDERRGTLLLARDPLGIKPLYVMPRAGGVVFASELKAIVAAVGPELTVDRRGLVASTLFYFLPEQIGAFREVRKLTPGTWAEYRPDGTSARGCSGTPWSGPWRRWSRRTPAPREVSPRREARNGRDAWPTWSRSRWRHTWSPTCRWPRSSAAGWTPAWSPRSPPGARPSIEAYTITFRAEDQRLEAMPDDAVYARKMAAHLGIRLHEIEISPDVVDMLPRIVDVLDEPIGDPARDQHRADVRGRARRRGEGAAVRDGRRRAVRRLPQAPGLPARGPLPEPAGALRSRVIGPGVERLPVAAAGRGLRYCRWAKRFLSFAELEEEAAFRRSYTLYDPEQLGALLHPDLAGDVAACSTGTPASTQRTIPAACCDHVNRMCLTDARLFLPGLNLTYTDRASMAASTEVRVPLVDVEVFQAAFGFTGRAEDPGSDAEGAAA